MRQVCLNPRSKIPEPHYATICCLKPCRKGTRWGETKTLPTIHQTTAGHASPVSKTDAMAATKTGKVGTPPVVRAASLSTGRVEIGVRTGAEMETESATAEQNASINSPCGFSQQGTGESIAAAFRDPKDPMVPWKTLSEGSEVRDRTSEEISAKSAAAERIESTSSSCGSSQQRTGEGHGAPFVNPNNSTVLAKTFEQGQDQHGQGQHGQGRAARRPDDRHRQKKPAIVREVRLSPDGTAAALLLADGSVWWVDDLDVGVWQPVTILQPSKVVSPAPRPRDTRTEEKCENRPDGEGKSREIIRQASSPPMSCAEAADGVTLGGLLSSRGISAIAVVRLRQGHTNDDSAGVCAGKSSGERGTETRPKHVGRMREGVAIVVGRDDGCLFLLTQARPTVALSADYCCADEAISKRSSGRGHDGTSPAYPWRVSASWKGPGTRVTAIWIVGGAGKGAPSQGDKLEGASCQFTSALETSRLSYPGEGCHGAGFDCALVSADANGTVAWWEWASAVNNKGAASDGNDSGAKQSENTGIRAPSLRMVSCSYCRCFHVDSWPSSSP